MGVIVLPSIRAVRVPILSRHEQKPSHGYPHHQHHYLPHLPHPPHHQYHEHHSQRQPHAKRRSRVRKSDSLLRMRRDENLRLRRLGSGLLKLDVIDSCILTHLSLLDRQKGGPYVLGGDLPDVDAHSHSSEHTGSFKGANVPQHAVKAMGARQTPRGSWPTSAESGPGTGGLGGGGKDKEFLGDLPVAAVRDMSASSSHSSIPQLPPIRHALSPIKDVSRETSQLVTLPPIHKEGHDEGEMPTVQVMPPTPQLSSYTAKPSPRSEGLQKVAEDAGGAEGGSNYQVSSDSSPTNSAAALTQRTGQKSRNKGPKVTHGEDITKSKGILFQPPERTINVHHPHHVFPPVAHHGHGWEYGRLAEGHRTGRSLAAGSVESKSMKGSMVMAPDGEIISVGGSVVPPKPADVGVISDVTPHLRQIDVNMTDESGMSDDEPDEWRAGSKMRKPRALSSKLSDSLKRSVGKRESQSSLGSGVKSVVSSEKEGKEDQAESGRISVVVDKPLIASKDTDNDSLASASIQIDYTSGDIDATMSIHSWSYAPKGEEGENGLVKAGSVRSLAGQSNEGGQKEALSTAEHTNDEDDEEDDERWARITERPEEEEVPNMSREPTTEELAVDSNPQGAHLSPHADATPVSQDSSSHPSVGDQIAIDTPENRYLTPGDKKSAPGSKHTTPRSASKRTTPAAASKHTTPGHSKHTTPGPSSKHPTPDPLSQTLRSWSFKTHHARNILTPGNMLGAELVPSANGPRPTPASAAHSQSEEDPEEDQEVPETARSRSIALQTDSASTDEQTPRGPSTSTSRRESGSKSGGDDEDDSAEDQWPSGKDVLDIVPEESQKGSAAASRITSSVAEKQATPESSHSQAAEENGLPGSKAESRKSESKAESRQGSSKTVRSRAASSRRGGSRSGSGSVVDPPHNETSTIREETNLTDTIPPSTVVDDQEREQGDVTSEEYNEDNEQNEDADHVSKEPMSSRSEKVSSKTGPSPHSESKSSQPASKPGSRVPSTQPSRHSVGSDVKSSITSEVKSSPRGSSKDDIENRDHAPSQQSRDHAHSQQSRDHAHSQQSRDHAHSQQSRDHAPSQQSRDHEQGQQNRDHAHSQQSRDHAPSQQSRDHEQGQQNRDHAQSQQSRDHAHSQQSRDHAPSQLKPRSSAKDSGSRSSSSSKTSHHSGAKSQAKDASRSMSTRLSEARMTTPPHVKDGRDPQWEEVGGPESSEQDDAEAPQGGYLPPSTPSSATEGTVKVSDEEPPSQASQGVALSVEGTQLLTPPGSPPYGRRTRMTVQESVTEETADTETVTIASRHSSVTEQDILDTLTEHAKRIADSVLSNNHAGHDLEQDVRNAADMWMVEHPTRDISRSHSVQDGLKLGAIEEIMSSQRRASSAGPTTDEYKDLIRQSLTTAVAKAAGLNPEEIPEDAEISPDLLDALASQKLSPDDIAIYQDEETGRPVIKSRQEMTQALGGVAEGHIYVAPNGKGGSHAGSEVGIKRQMSIPADRASLVDNMEYDVISYGGTEVMSERGRPAGRSKAGSKPGSIAGGTVADLRDYPTEAAKISGESSPDGVEQDEFKQRLEQIEKEKDDGDGKSASLKGSIKEERHSPVPPGDTSPKSPEEEQDKQSEKSAKTALSQKSEKSDDSKKKEKKVKTPEEPFVVGKSDKKGELEKLYGPVDQPPKKKEKGKAETKAKDKSPTETSPRKSPRKSDTSDPPPPPPPAQKSPPKSPPPKEKTPSPKAKSPVPTEQKSPRKEEVTPKPNKTPRPEPAGEEAAPPKEKQEKAPKRSQRQKKEKTAFPRRGSRAMEAELKARLEREKEASLKGSEATEISDLPEEKPEEKADEKVEEKPEEKPAEQKVPEVPPEPVTKPADPVETDNGAKTAGGGAASPPAQEGLVDHKAELSKLYGTQGPGTLPSAKVENKSPVKGKKPKKDDKKDKSKKKGGKGKKKGKKEEEATPEVVEEAPPPAPAPVVAEPEPPKEPVKEPVKEPPPLPTPREPEPKPMTASSSERNFMSSPELTRTDDEMEFTIVREESSPEPEPPKQLNIPAPFPEEEEEEEEEDEEPTDAADGNLKSISNREARAAKRAAAAAKRKEEVEKRRREREEQLKREKEEQERQEQLKKEMETERKRREEERRLRKQQEAEEAMKEERAREEAERKKRLAEERERRAKEDYQRKLEEMKRKQIEEEAKRMELLIQKQKEEEERRAQEELMMSQMAEQERLEYERKKKEEEAERKRLEEEERLKREEEARKAMEEARRLAEEMARKQAELEARLKFNRALQVEASGLDHSHDINRAFVFSYFELLQWLGLDIPEFELAKMTQL